MVTSAYNSGKKREKGSFNLLPAVNLIPYNAVPGTSTHQTLNIFPLIAEINIYESIYEPFITGNLVIVDADNIFEKNIPIVGFERLEFQLMTPGIDAKYDFQTQTGSPMHIYSITNRNASTFSSQSYVINFCSQEMIRNKTSFVSKAVYNTHENIVSMLLTQYMNSKKPLLFEKTTSRHKMVLPYAQPLDHIYHIANKTQSAYHENPGYLFFENLLGFHFRSLQSLTNLNSGAPRHSKHGIKYKHRRIDFRGNSDKNVDYQMGGIMHYEIVKQFDTIDSLDEGAYSSELVHYDQTSKKFNSKIFKYNEHFDKNPSMENNKGKRVGNFVYRDNQTMQELPSKRYFKSNTSQLFGNDNITTSPEIDITQPKNAKYSNMRNTVVEITVPGYLGIQAGDVVDVDFPTYSHRNKNTYEDDIDKRMSGLYMVASLRHTFDTTVDGKHDMILQLQKDAFKVSPPNSNTDTFTGLETTKSLGSVEIPQ